MRAARAVELVERPEGRCDLVIVTAGVSVIVCLDADEAVNLAGRLLDGGAPPACLEAAS